jgi:hypothetical protein
MDVPALRSVPFLAERWRDVGIPWGPGGSVGFELATGREVVRPQSDLDIVMYAERRMTPDEARHLLDSAQGLPAAVDIRVETPVCGFSLLEYARRTPEPILLRTVAGAVLGDDPWDRRRRREWLGPGRCGSPVSIAFLFPGQGSQASGMLHALPAHPAVTRTFEEAGDVCIER